MRVLGWARRQLDLARLEIVGLLDMDQDGEVEWHEVEAFLRLLCCCRTPKARPRELIPPPNPKPHPQTPTPTPTPNPQP